MDKAFFDLGNDGTFEDVEDGAWPALETSESAAGALVSTAADVAVFTEALFTGRIVSPETGRQMVSGSGFGRRYDDSSWASSCTRRACRPWCGTRRPPARLPLRHLVRAGNRDNGHGACQPQPGEPAGSGEPGSRRRDLRHGVSLAPARPPGVLIPEGDVGRSGGGVPSRA